MPVHKDWTGFTGEEYRIASESVEAEAVPEIRPIGRQINFSGYQTVRGEFFGTLDRPALTISAGKMRFNKVCLDKFVDVEYVELLLNPTKRCIAIRPCSSDNPNAIRWGKLKEGRWAVRDLSCRGLSRVLVDVMDWTAEDRYRFCGEFTQTKEGKLLLFTLDEPVITRTETRIYVPEKEDTQEHAEADTEQGAEEVVFTETVKIYPPSWAETFGKPITSIAAVSLLERRHYKVLGYLIEVDNENVYVFDFTVKRVYHERPKKGEPGHDQPIDRKGFYPDDVANTFGVPVEEHARQTEITEEDGYVNVAMLTGPRRTGRQETAEPLIPSGQISFDELPANAEQTGEEAGSGGDLSE